MANSELKIEYVTYEHEQSNEPTDHESTWGELGIELTQHDRTDCDPCPGGKQCKAKFGLALSPGIPREGTGRRDENIEYVTFLMLDFDHLTQAEAEGVSERLEGLELIAHSTHSHRHGLPANVATGAPAVPPEADICFRVALPYSRPLKPTEHRKVRQAFVDKYQLEWTRPDGSRAGADPARKDLSGIYFFPSAPKSLKDDELIAFCQPGALFDVAELLKTPTKVKALKVVGTPVVPAGPAPEPASVDIEAIRKLLREYSPRRRPEDEGEVISKKDLARRVAMGEPLVKVDEVGQRDHSCNRIGFILGRNFSGHVTDEDTLLHLVDTSVRKMPVYDDDDPEKDGLPARFDKVVRGWTNGRNACEKQKVEWAERKAKRSEAHTSLLAEKYPARFGKPAVPPPPVPASSQVLALSAASDAAVPEACDEPGTGDGDGEDDEDAESAEAEEAEANWVAVKKLLLRMPAKEDEAEGALVRAGANAGLILEHEPRWRNVIRFNEVTKDVTVVGAPLRKHETHEAAITISIGNWLQLEYGLVLPSNAVQDQISLVARANAFNPLQDYLLKEITPDGGERIDTFLEVYCGAVTTDASGRDITKLIRKISRRWLIGSVARGLDPGCQMDNVLILEGEQGIKKSRFLRALGGKFFADSAINLTDKDSKMLAAQHWIIELAELSSLRASESEAQKAFFSSPTDKFRPPYGRVIENFPRICVFVGTTNDEQYMLDATGNRRPWPVRCTALDARKVRRDRDLIWAEAVAAYKAGFTCPDCVAADGEGGVDNEEDRCPEHRWWLTLEENKALEGQNNQRLRSGHVDTIREWLLKMKPEDRPKELTTHMVAHEALELAADRIESQYRSIGLALKALGCPKPQQRRVAGGTDRFYAVPEAILLAPSKARSSGSHLHAVPNPPEPVKK